MARRRKPIFVPRETAIQAACLEHWLVLGVPGSLVAAIPNAFAHGQPGLTKGLPDLMVISPTLGDRVGLLELKADGGTPSDEQLAIGDLMRARGIPYAIVYGRDEPIRWLELWGAVRPASAAA
jgi:hypothetical protein